MSQIIQYCEVFKVYLLCLKTSLFNDKILLGMGQGTGHCIHGYKFLFIWSHNITHKYMGKYSKFLEIMGNGDMGKVLQIEIYG